MYMWSENVAGRGGQETGSCILKHLNEKIPESAEKVIIYSDSCGGQNRNVKLMLFLKKVLSEHSTLKEIEQKFFVSGHSFNSCDRSFAVIENSVRKQNLNTPDEWLDFIQQAKKREPKFIVIKMTSSDFFSSYELEQLITNRKKDVNGKKVSWLAFRSIKCEKDKLFEYSVNNKSAQINIKKKSVEEELFKQTKLQELYPNGRAIDEKKFKDLMDLTKFIDPKYRPFYENLKYNFEQIDYGLASDNEDDF